MTQPRVKGQRVKRKSTLLRCVACGEVLTSEKGAERHAHETGHTWQDAIVKVRR